MVARFNARSGRATVQVSGIQQAISTQVFEKAKALANDMEVACARRAPGPTYQARTGRWVQTYHLSEPAAYYSTCFWSNLMVYASVVCRADHAKYVIEGHFSHVNGGKLMQIPVGPWGPVRVRAVRGVPGNWWMEIAMDMTLAEKGYL